MPEDYSLMDRSGDMPPDADYYITLSSDDMEPAFHAGDMVCVSCRDELRELDAGIFSYEGRILCRQWCEDYSGALHLLCANPDRQSENIRISREKRSDCICLGRVLTDRPLPRPIYR